jgi:hypothetical protein
MKVVYANENYAKYSMRGMNYFMALMAATFYIMLTGFAILVLLSAISPAFYTSVRNFHSGLPSIVEGAVALGIIFTILRISVKEKSLKSDNYTKESVRKAVNYLIFYAFAIVVLVCFLGMKYLRH